MTPEQAAYFKLYVWAAIYAASIGIWYISVEVQMWLRMGDVEAMAIERSGCALLRCCHWLCLSQHEHPPSAAGTLNLNLPKVFKRQRLGGKAKACITP